MGDDVSHLFPSERGLPVRFEFDKLGKTQVVFVDVRQGSSVVSVEGGILDETRESERFSFHISWRQALELANAISEAYQTARSNDHK